MTWDEAGSIVTGAIGIGVGLAVGGKIIKDLTSIRSEEKEEPKKPTKKPDWWL